ncbi:MAG: DNA recombination protein RmuC [Actinobacteria bacterium]|nr:DNA recombination protein RmuC [Actinomycetota bacterium]
MEIALPIIIILVLGFAAIIYFINKNSSKNKTDDTLLEWLKNMQSTINSTNKMVHDSLNTSSNQMIKTLQENSKQLNERLDKAASVIKDVGLEVGKMSEIGRNMRELQDFLKSPKLRGNIGEQVLKDLISQMFPKNSFHLQYQFKSGNIVDAAIKTDAGILSIDSKFPMENFQKMVKSEDEKEKDIYKKEFIKDVKKHIDAISKKYILPGEGTMDFALMYVPSESVFYEIINLAEIVEYARQARVYIVSPNTLYIHLQTILLSFEGKKIEHKSKEIIAIFRAMHKDYEKTDENLSILGKHINNAASQFSNVTLNFSQLGQKINSTKNLDEKTSLQLEE